MVAHGLYIRAGDCPRGHQLPRSLHPLHLRYSVPPSPSRALLISARVRGRHQPPQTPEQTVGAGRAATAAPDKAVHALTSALAGFLLGRVVKQYKRHQKLRGWPLKVPSDALWDWRKKCLLEVFYVAAFLVACRLLKTETRSLFNFFLSSFVCPMLRFCIPARSSRA